MRPLIPGLKIKKLNKAAGLIVSYSLLRKCSIYSAAIIGLVVFALIGLPLFLQVAETAIEYRQLKKTLNVWAQKARQLNLTYDQCRRNPDQAVGKPVIWRIAKHSDKGIVTAYYQGDHNSPVRLKEHFFVPYFNSKITHSAADWQDPQLCPNCVPVVGVVSEIKNGVIELIALGPYSP